MVGGCDEAEAGWKAFGGAAIRTGGERREAGESWIPFFGESLRDLTILHPTVSCHLKNRFVRHSFVDLGCNVRSKRYDNTHGSTATLY